jgi:outer membrane murein-binding lipoprotein Lpp
MIRRRSGVIVLLAVACLVLALAGCSARKPSRKSTASTAVSSVPPATHPFSEQVRPARPLKQIASAGGCEPTYLNGTKGSCVGGKPCRGYGVIDEAGHEQCECFLSRGGCLSQFRCEAVRAGCVPDDKSHADP